MNARAHAIEEITKRKNPNPEKQTFDSDTFGIRTFSRRLLQQKLPKEIYRNVSNAMEGLEKIKPEYADTIAVAIKEWATSHGATHFCHWFQPLTGIAAEKHDAFIDWDTTQDRVIEKFNGKQLVQGEPDASSFPSGGLRSTYEARGYTGWDPTSPIFLWKGGDGVTLCIPSVFFSWTGNVLDAKIPLLRSDQKISDAVMRLLRLTQIPADYVYSTVGLEQEYFVVDRSLRNLRSDLVLHGKTVFGAPSPKGQELQDHYFGTVKDRVLAFMQAFEMAAIELGIPVKTRHNEVAPSQYEVAPIFEKAAVAVDHNILLMEIMRQVAPKHGLSCLLHEKPFAGINGSGKHANWSLSTNTGINLLDPSDTPSNNWHFLILLAAILNGVYKHSTLLRAAIGSASNDYRLGGHEAPPAIISIYMGRELEQLVHHIEQQTPAATSRKAKLDLGILTIPEMSQDNTDRNRTSPFAFTGNKFEFRAVGSSANPAFAITVLNLIVAESLNAIMDEIEEKFKHQKSEDLSKAILPVLQKYFIESRPIRFSGDNYSDAWVKEAHKRGLPNLKKSPESFAIFTEPQTVKLFEGILAEPELASRQEIAYEHYVHHTNIEVNLMIDIFKTQILPASLNYLKSVAKSCDEVTEVLDLKRTGVLSAYLKNIHTAVEKGLEKVQELEKVRAKAEDLPLHKRALSYSHEVMDKMEELREAADALENLVEDQLWPLPKYREILFMV